MLDDLPASRRGADPRHEGGVPEIRWHVLSADERARLQHAAATILPRYEWVRAAWLHGSAAPEGHPGRDLDIGLLARPLPRKWGEEARLAGDLAEATGIHDVPFDVRIVNGASPVFLNNMLRSAVRLYEADRGERILFEARAMALWLDFQPVWEKLRREALERWSHG